MKPHVEIRRKNDTPFFQPHEANWRSIPLDVRQHVFGLMETDQLIYIREAHLVLAFPAFGLGHCGH